MAQDCWGASSEDYQNAADFRQKREEINIRQVKECTEVFKELLAEHRSLNVHKLISDTQERIRCPRATASSAFWQALGIGEIDLDVKLRVTLYEG